MGVDATGRDDDIVAGASSGRKRVALGIRNPTSPQSLMRSLLLFTQIEMEFLHAAPRCEDCGSFEEYCVPYATVT